MGDQVGSAQTSQNQGSPSKAAASSTLVWQSAPGEHRGAQPDSTCKSLWLRAFFGLPFHGTLPGGVWGLRQEGSGKQRPLPSGSASLPPTRNDVLSTLGGVGKEILKGRQF